MMNESVDWLLKGWSIDQEGLEFAERLVLAYNVECLIYYGLRLRD